MLMKSQNQFGGKCNDELRWLHGDSKIWDGDKIVADFRLKLETMLILFIEEFEI